MPMRNKIWLRSEKKEMERRTPLTPQDAAKLIEAGALIHVEDDPNRIFPTSEYQQVGCHIEPAHSWESAPLDFTILGLKEILDPDVSFKHHHIYFAHVFKEQEGHEDILKRYKEDQGTLFDLEYLTDSNKRRVAAFGHWAGFAGAAFALDYFFHLHIKEGSNYPPLKSYDCVEDLLSSISKKRESTTKANPRVMIFGAKGRCGNGASEVFNHFGLEQSLWDFEETKGGGPFKEICDHDIFINAALITKKIPPFLNHEVITGDSTLSVIADVSCDPNSELNPIPIYNQHTNWKDPFLKLEINGRKLSLMSVDNLPSTLPKESSIDFSSQLFPHLLEYVTKKGSLPTPFENAKNTFLEKII